MSELILPLAYQVRENLHPPSYAEDLARIVDRSMDDERRRSFAVWDFWVRERGPGYWSVVFEDG